MSPRPALTAMAGIGPPAAALLLAFALRMVALDGPALRGDEAHTVMAWAGSLSEVIETMATVDPHPPLAYLAFNLWLRVAGDSEFAARFLSVLAGVLGVAAVYALGRVWGGRTLGLVAALLMALNPFHVWHSQDARNYALWAAISALAVWLMLRALRRGTAKHAWRRTWLPYIAAQIAAAYIFYFEVALLAFQNVYVLLAHRRARALLRRWFLAQAAIALVVAPWYLYPRLQEYTGTAEGLDLGGVFTWIVPALLFGETLPPGMANWLWVPAWALVGAGLVAAWRVSRERFAFLAAYAGVPLAALCALSLVQPVFRPRYILASMPAYVLIVAGLVTAVSGWRGLPAKSRQRAVGTLWGGLALVMALGLWHHFTNPLYAKSPDWRALAAFLEARAAPGDIVVQNIPDPAFGYYYQGAHITLPARASRAAEPIPAADDTAAQLAALLEEHRALWFLPAPDPAWDADATALHWLEANAQQIDDLWVGSFRVQQWRGWHAPLTELATLSAQTAIRVDDFASLVGYEVDPRPSLRRGAVEARGKRLRLVLYWTPATRAPADYTVFVHLEGALNPETGTPLWAQDDHPPQWGRAPTSQWHVWPPGTLLRDVFTLDLAGVPPGTYTVRVGMYDPISGERVRMVDTATGRAGDSAALFEVVVREAA